MTNNPKENAMTADTTLNPYDALQTAWGLIANAHGGDWSEASDEWREAAERWRDEQFHPLLDREDR